MRKQTRYGSARAFLCSTFVALLAGCGPLSIGSAANELFKSDQTPDTTDPIVQFASVPQAQSVVGNPIIVVSANERLQPDPTGTLVRLDDPSQTHAAVVGMEIMPRDPVRFCFVLTDAIAGATQLPDGVYTFTVDGADLSSNPGATAAPFEWEIDTTPPGVPGGRRVQTVGQTSATFAWAAVLDSNRERGVKYRLRARLRNAGFGTAGIVSASVPPTKVRFEVDAADLDPQQDGFYDGMNVRFVEPLAAQPAAQQDEENPCPEELVRRILNESRRVTSYKFDPATQRASFEFDSSFREAPQPRDSFEIIARELVLTETTGTLELEPCRLYEVSVAAEDDLGNVSEEGEFGLVRTECGGTGEFDEQPLFLFNGATFQRLDDPQLGDERVTEPVAVALGDFDEDGQTDVALLEPNRLRILRNLGRNQGMFNNAMVDEVGFQVIQTITPLAADPVALQAVDLDRDGALDLVVLHAGRQLAVYTGEADGMFEESEAFDVEFEADKDIRTMAIVDFNLDGVLDLALGGDSSEIVLLCGDPSPDANDPPFENCDITDRLVLDNDETVRALAIADVNNDRILDLIVSNFSSPNLTVFAGDGRAFDRDAVNDDDAPIADNLPIEQDVDPVTVGVGSLPAAVIGHDLDGDRIADLGVLAPNVGLSTGAVRVLLGSDDVFRKLGTVQPTRYQVADSDTFMVAKTQGTVSEPGVFETTSVGENGGTVKARTGKVDTSRREGDVEIPAADKGDVAAPDDGEVEIPEIVNIANPTYVVVSTSGATHIEGPESLSNTTTEDFVGMTLRLIRPGQGSTNDEELPITGYDTNTEEFTFAAPGFDPAPATTDSFQIISKRRLFVNANIDLVPSDDFYTGRTLRLVIGSDNEEKVIESPDGHDYDSTKQIHTFRFNAANAFTEFLQDGDTFDVIDPENKVFDVKGNDLSDEPGFYDDMKVRFTNGPNVGDSEEIEDYIVTTDANDNVIALTIVVKDGFEDEPTDPPGQEHRFVIESESRFNTDFAFAGDPDDLAGRFLRFPEGVNKDAFVEILEYVEHAAPRPNEFKFDSDFPNVPVRGDDFEIVDKTAFEGTFDNPSTFTPAPGMFVRFPGTAPVEIDDFDDGRFTLVGDGLDAPPKEDDAFVVEDLKRFDAKNLSFVPPTDAADEDGDGDTEEVLDKTLRVRFTSGSLAGEGNPDEFRTITHFDGTTFTLDSDLSEAPRNNNSFHLESREEFDVTLNAGNVLPKDMPDDIAGRTLRITPRDAAAEERKIISTFDGAKIVLPTDGALDHHAVAGDGFEVASKTAFEAPVGFVDPGTLVGRTLRFTSGNNENEDAVEITGYLSDTRTFETEAMEEFPEAGDGVEIEGGMDFIAGAGLSGSDDAYGKVEDPGEPVVPGRDVRFFRGDPPVQFDSAKINGFDADKKVTLDKEVATQTGDTFCIDPDGTRFEGPSDFPGTDDDPSIQNVMIRFAGKPDRTVQSYKGTSRTLILDAALSPAPMPGEGFEFLSEESFSARLPDDPPEGDPPLSSENDFYVGMLVQFDGSTAAPTVDKYVGSTRAFTLTGNPATIEDGTLFVLLSTSRVEGDDTLPGVNGFFNGGQLKWITGKLQGQVGNITGYAGPTRTLTFANPFTGSFPAENDTFLLELEDKSDNAGDVRYTRTQTFTPGAFLAGMGVSGLVACDVNADGALDLLVASVRPVQAEGAAVTNAVVQFAADGGEFSGDAGLSDQDGFYTGMILRFDSDTQTAALRNVQRNVTSYDGATRTFFIEPEAFPATPVTGDSFVLAPADSVGEVSLILGHITDGRPDGTFNDPVSALGRAVVSVQSDGLGLRGDRTLSNADGFYLDRQLRFISGELEGTARRIAEYQGGTRTITFDEPLVFLPSIGDTFVIEIAPPVHLAAGDLNGDGIPDLVTVNRDPSGGDTVPAGISILFGKGRNGMSDGGLLDTTGFVDVTFQGQPRDLLVRDFDDDSDPDVAVLLNPDNEGDDPAAAVFLRTGREIDGRPRFAPASLFTIPQQVVGEDEVEDFNVLAFAPGDFTHDGVVDLAVVGTTMAIDPDRQIGFLTVLEAEAPDRRATGEFQVAVPEETCDVAGGDPAGRVVLRAGDFFPKYRGEQPERRTEKATDVVMAGPGGLFFVVGEAGREGLLGLPGDDNPGGLDTDASYHDLAVGDFGSDGVHDLAALQDTGEDPPRHQVLIYAGKRERDDPAETTELPFENPVAVVEGTDLRALTVGDFDGDHLLDLAVVSANNVQIHLNQGDGTFDAGAQATITGGSFVTAADLDGNGVLDVLVAGAAGVTVLRGEIEADVYSFVLDPQDPPQVLDADGEEPRSIVVEDFNRDAVADVAVLFDGRVRIFFGVDARTKKE